MVALATYNAIPSDLETIISSSKTVTTAGTAVALGASTVKCHEVQIQPKQSNTGKIFVGGSTITNTGSNGFVFDVPVAGTTPPAVSWSITNLGQLYINSTVNGEGVNINYW